MEEIGGKIPTRVLYVAPKKSERLQGIADTVKLLWEECYVMQSDLYGGGSIFQNIQMANQNLYLLEQHIQQLRKQGL